MNINALRDFVAIAQSGSFLVASKELFISSSSLSYMIKSLEKELGVPLFATSNKGASLTEYGRLFLPYAINALNDLDNGISEITRLSTQQQVVNIATVGSLIKSQVPWLAKQFYSTEEGRHANVKIHMHAAGECIQMLESGTCDIAFTDLNTRKISPEYETYPVAFDKFWLILPQRHELLGRKKISMKDLLPYDFVSFNTNTAARRIICNRFEQECGMLPNIIASFDYSFEIAGMVAAGLGVSIIPDRKLVDPDRLVFRQIDNKPWMRTFGIVYRKESLSRKVVRDFVGYIKKWIPVPISSYDFPDQHISQNTSI